MKVRKTYLARGGGETVAEAVVSLPLFSATEAIVEEDEAESFIGERLSFKSTLAVSEKPLFPQLFLIGDSP